MRCPYCAEERDRVVDSRSAESGAAIRRRRECQACGKRFTTYEHIERVTRLVVVKRDRSRVPFDRQKILAGLEKACYKRPVSAAELAAIADEVEESFAGQPGREVEALAIGQAVAERLKRLDHVAYVRFASVYKQFRDLEDLLEEVRDVLEHEEEPPEQESLF